MMEQKTTADYGTDKLVDYLVRTEQTLLNGTKKLKDIAEKHGCTLAIVPDAEWNLPGAVARYDGSHRCLEYRAGMNPDSAFLFALIELYKGVVDFQQAGESCGVIVNAGSVPYLSMSLALGIQQTMKVLARD